MSFDPALPPSIKNPGGGVAVKLLNLKKAIPSIKITPYMAEIGAVNITEALWFSGKNASPELVEKRIVSYEQCSAFKVLWTSDFEFARWLGVERDRIFEATDVICGNSPYMVNILSAYADDVMLLTDPIDEYSIMPMPKKNRIVAMSQVALEKNIDAIINIFLLVGESSERWFIGDTTIWGMAIKDKVADVLDTELDEVCDYRIKRATRREVANTLGETLIYVADSRFDTFCYSMVESMLAGCYCFVGSHPIYDGRPCDRFVDADDAAEQIIDFVNTDNLEPNMEAREFAIDNYGLDKFRSQLSEILEVNFA